MMETPYLCVLYVATAGQQGPGLGADEEEIVLMVYIVIDMPQNKVREHFFGGGWDLPLMVEILWVRYPVIWLLKFMNYVLFDAFTDLCSESTFRKEIEVTGHSF